MDKLPNPFPDQPLEELEQRIRNTPMPRQSMSNEIMSQIEGRNMNKQRNGSTILKRTLTAASIAAVMGAGAIGAGFVSPTMASTLKQIPGIGSMFYGLSSDEIGRAVDQGILTQPLKQITKDGVTLTLTNVLYDGTRLSYTIERAGEHLPQKVASPYIPMDSEVVSGDNEWKKSRQVPEQQQQKGYVTAPETFINNEELKSFRSYGDDIGNSNAVFAEYTNLGSLPNEFELTVRTKVTRVEEPFEFKVPVKISDNKLVIQPNETKSFENFSYTLQKIESTVTNTRLILESTGKVPASSEQTGKYAPTMMYYEIVDDQGKVLNQRKLDFFHRAPDLEYQVDELYDAISPNAKSVTIKPYTFTVNTDNWGVVGEKIDEQHKIVSSGDKTYIKELEMDVTLKP
ncbi:DUF4179 domain-containing protein [Paenibacillus silvae]|uniref:DUF4179 domain-containing protein n=1 Tax=Paenibacillus silvae TaxID=1325358 RepID=UPI00119F290A|nr:MULTISPECIES: DUF4179 domain-containing protein [Paenibacillus]MCK6074561.1 DUF4179 domain-containing protein [Paenibacillus silvae]MCK6147963.1 DUF4179 domain-containing protein [Paenibacillus silvae]MCK6266261.1 DUF4179 domain-containing protein [Paenibacillus silvae]